MSGRTKAYIAGATALLAVLVVLLCVLSGAFNFHKDGGTEPTATLQVPETPPPTKAPVSTQPPTAATPPPLPVVSSYTITVTAGLGGSVSPRGTVSVNEGESVTFTITPEEGYETSEVKVDGQSVGACETYTFMDVSGDHTLYTVFRQKSEETPPPEETAPADTPEIESTATDIDTTHGYF